MSTSPQPEGFLQSLLNAASPAGAEGQPSDIWEGPKQLVTHPIDSMKLLTGAYSDASNNELQQSKTALANKDYVRAGLHGIGYALPMVGPLIAKAGEQANAHNFAGAAGTTMGLAGPALAGEALGKPLAAEHPQIASEAVTEHANTGGSTFEPTTGKNLAGSHKIAVGIAPEAASVSDRPFTPDQYSSYVGQNRDLLAQHPTLAVGTHFDPATGLHHMELVGTTSSKGAAAALANHLGEDHVFNLATDEKIPTDVDAERPVSHLSIGERVQQLNAMSPQKQPYSGMHYSDAQLDMLDGSRRGQPGNNGMTAGAEAARVRLGTDTGLGQDAPSGFYTYKAGTIPDKGVSLRKNAYSVRGSMAFGNTTSPEFINAYHDGVEKALGGGSDRATAHALGLNAGENALKDAGFDGYMNPAHPNVRFHFGNSAAEPVAIRQAPDIDWGKISDPALADVEAAQKGRAKEVQAKYPGKTVEPVRDPFAAPEQPTYTEPTWPENYRQPIGTNGGGANYSAADLEAFKALHNIPTVPSELVGAK